MLCWGKFKKEMIPRISQEPSGGHPARRTPCCWGPPPGLSHRGQPLRFAAGPPAGDRRPDSPVPAGGGGHRLLRQGDGHGGQNRPGAVRPGGSRVRRHHHRRGDRGRPVPGLHGQGLPAGGHPHPVPAAGPGGHPLQLLLPRRRLRGGRRGDGRDLLQADVPAGQAGPLRAPGTSGGRALQAENKETGRPGGLPVSLWFGGSDEKEVLSLARPIVSPGY